MITWRKNLLWIWTALFLSMAGFGFAYPIIPFYLQDVLHVTEQARRDFYIALFAFAGNLGFLLFSPIWGKMADYFGRARMLARASLCSAFLMPLVAFMPDPISLTILRFFIGALSGVAAAAMTLVACSTPKQHRGMAMGVVSSAIFSGTLAGTVLGGLSASRYGFLTTFLMSGALLFIATFLAFFLIQDRGKPPHYGEKFRIELKPGLPKFGLVWWIMILTVMMGIGQQMDSPYLPMLVDLVLHNGTSEALKWSGILGGASAAAGIFGGFIIGVLADKYPGHIVGIIISIAAGLFLLPQAFCTSLPILFAERMLMVFFVSGLSPIMQSWLSLTTAPEDRGVYFGFATSARAVGWLLGCVFGMGSTIFWNTRSVFAVSSIVLFAIAVVIVFAQRKIPYPPHDLKKKTKQYT